MTLPELPTSPWRLQPLALASARKLWPAATGLVGGWMLLDSLHLQLSPLLSLAAAGGGLWLLSQRSSRPAGPRPTNSFGWLERCETALSRFERLELTDGEAQCHRRQRLDQLRLRQQRQHLELALVGTALPSDQHCASLAAQCRSPLPLQVHRGHPLPSISTDWQWPSEFRYCDQLLYALDLPLKAVDLRWLETLPAQQPVWLLVHAGAPGGSISRGPAATGRSVA